MLVTLELDHSLSRVMEYVEYKYLGSVKQSIYLSTLTPDYPSIPRARDKSDVFLFQRCCCVLSSLSLSVVKFEILRTFQTVKKCCDWLRYRESEIFNLTETGHRSSSEKQSDEMIFLDLLIWYCVVLSRMLSAIQKNHVSTKKNIFANLYMKPLGSYCMSRKQ